MNTKNIQGFRPRIMMIVSTLLVVASALGHAPQAVGLLDSDHARLPGEPLPQSAPSDPHVIARIAEESHSPAISADGRYIVFTSEASNLVAGNTNEREDVFVYDHAAARLVRVSIPDPSVSDTLALYEKNWQGNSRSYGASISGDGRYVVFNSMAHNLVSDNPTIAADAFVHDRLTGETRRLCDPGIGEPGSAVLEVSRDGRYALLFDRGETPSPPSGMGKGDVFVTPLDCGN